MAALTITPSAYTFFKNATTGASQVVGYESSSERGIRYTFKIPSSRPAGATSYSFTKTQNGFDGGGTKGKQWNYAISTSASEYLNTTKAGDGSGNAAATFTGSKTGLKLLPNTTYYLFIYPGQSTTTSWYYWNFPEDNFTLSVDGSITYTITYDDNGGSGAPNDQTKTHGTDLTLSSTKPTKGSTIDARYAITYDTAGGNTISDLLVNKTTSYTFDNWKDNNGNTYAAGASYKINDDLALTAQYTSETSTASVTLPTPTKSGYTFNGWYTAASGGTKVGDAGDSYTPTKTTTLYAQWTAAGYTISYTLNGGTVSGSGNPTSYTADTATFTLKNPTKNGYDFTGWTGSNGDTPQTSVSIAKGSAGNKSYTANWTPKTYSISYTLNGGTVSGGNPTSYTIETATFTLKNPTRTNYTFTGWTSSNSTSPETTVTIEKGSTGDKSYTANWSQSVISYTISYNYDGGAKGTYAPTSANVDSYIQISNPTKSGYTFKGWTISGMNPTSSKKCYYGSSTTDSSNQFTTSTSLSGITATRFKNLRTSAGIVTFKATWEENQVEDNEYSITYSLGGGTAGSPAPTSGTKGTYINIANPTRTNYTFTGWNITGLDSGTHYHGTSRPMYENYGATAATGTSISGVTSTWFSLQATGTVTFTATWESTQTTTSYTISYNYDGGTKGTYAPTSGTVGEYVRISNPTKSGYTFTGWTISGLSVSYNSPAYHGTTQTDSSNTRVTSGITLSGITSTYFKNLRSSSGTVTFKATWESTQTTTSYTIAYSLNGGTAGASAPTSANVGSYVQISNPTRSGYTFAGWNITGMNPTSTDKCYYGNYTTDTYNQSTTATSLSGITATRFKNLRTSAGTVTFTAVWEIIEGDDELTGLILRPISDTTLGHTCSSGTSGYSMISETASDDDTTYIAQQITQTTDQIATSTFKLGGTLPDGVFKITGATIKVRGKSASNGTYSGTYQLSTDSAASAIILSGTAYESTTNSNVCDNLIGNMYTKNNFPEISVTITTTGRVASTGTKTGQTTSEIRITQVYLQLEYEPVIGLAKIYTQNAWHNALAYIFINGAWKMAQAQTRRNSNWKPGQGS